MEPKEKLAGKMTAKKRNSLKTSTFGLPSQRKYPVNDRKHAILAKGFAKKELGKGKLSSSQYQQIVNKANKKLKG